jgi:tripartite-type tricarboxylate transporter receptor subunit TctC
MVPKGTPQDIVKKLHDATVTAMEDRDVQKQMLAAGAMVVAPDRRSIDYFKAFVPKEIDKNGAPIRAAGLSVE